jgi:hypothetical protein
MHIHIHIYFYFIKSHLWAAADILRGSLDFEASLFLIQSVFS